MIPRYYNYILDSESFNYNHYNNIHQNIGTIQDKLGCVRAQVQNHKYKSLGIECLGDCKIHSGVFASLNNNL